MDQMLQPKDIDWSEKKKKVFKIKTITTDNK